MTSEPAAAPIERLRAVRRIGEPVIGARDHVERARLGGPLEEQPAVGGRHHVVALALDHASARSPPSTSATSARPACSGSAPGRSRSDAGAFQVTTGSGAPPARVAATQSAT